MDTIFGHSPEEIGVNEEAEEDWFGVPKIAIVGVGGAGNNSMNRLESLGGLNGVDRIAINTDKLHLVR